MLRREFRGKPRCAVLSVNVIMRGAVGLLAAVIVVTFSLSAFEAWQRYRVAARIHAVAEVTQLLFTALPNLRTDRNNTERDFQAKTAVKPNPRVLEARARSPRRRSPPQRGNWPISRSRMPPTRPPTSRV